MIVIIVLSVSDVSAGHPAEGGGALQIDGHWYNKIKRIHSHQVIVSLIRGRKVGGDCIEERLNTFVSQRASAEHRDRFPGQRHPPHGFLQLRTWTRHVGLYKFKRISGLGYFAKRTHYVFPSLFPSHCLI